MGNKCTTGDNGPAPRGWVRRPAPPSMGGLQSALEADIVHLEQELRRVTSKKNTDVPCLANGIEIWVHQVKCHTPRQKCYYTFVVSTERWSSAVTASHDAIFTVCQSLLTERANFGRSTADGGRLRRSLKAFPRYPYGSSENQSSRRLEEVTKEVLNIFADQPGSEYMSCQALLGLNVPRTTINLNITDDRRVLWGPQKGEYAAKWVGMESIQVREDMLTTIADIKMSYIAASTHGRCELDVDLVPAEVHLNYAGEPITDDFLTLKDLSIESDATLSLFVDVGAERSHRVMNDQLRQIAGNTASFVIKGFTGPMKDFRNGSYKRHKELVNDFPAFRHEQSSHWLCYNPSEAMWLLQQESSHGSTSGVCCTRVKYQTPWADDGKWREHVDGAWKDVDIEIDTAPSSFDFTLFKGRYSPFNGLYQNTGHEEDGFPVYQA